LFTLDLQSRLPISEQVLEHLRTLIISGVIKESEKLPSVRELSGKLTCSPNTVQKAFTELERQGYVYSSAGLGTFAAPSEKWISAEKPEEARLRESVQALVAAGRSYAQIIDLIRKMEEGRAK